MLVKRNKNVIILIIFLLFMITMGVGYSIISSIDISINGSGNLTAEQKNFKVMFLNSDSNKPTIDGSPTNIINIEDDTTASFNVSTLSKKGDCVNAIIKIKNESNSIGAKIALDITNSNIEYFNVEEYIDDNVLNSGDITFVKISIEMIKTPIDNVETANIVAKLIVNPVKQVNEKYSDLVGSPYKTIYCTDCSGLFEESFDMSKNVFSYNINDVFTPDKPISLKLKLDSNNDIYSTDVEILLNNNSYVLKGSSSLDSSQTIISNLEYNKTILHQIYGEENCYEEMLNNEKTYRCNSSSLNFYPILLENGTIYFVDSMDSNTYKWECYIDSGNDEFKCD